MEWYEDKQYKNTLLKLIQSIDKRIDLQNAKEILRELIYLEFEQDKKWIENYINNHIDIMSEKNDWRQDDYYLELLEEYSHDIAIDIYREHLAEINNAFIWKMHGDNDYWIYLD